KIVGKIDLTSLKKGGKAQRKVEPEEKAQVAEEETTEEAKVEPKPSEAPVEEHESTIEPLAEKKEEQPTATEAEKATPDEDTPNADAPEVAAKQESEGTETKKETRGPTNDVIRARAQRLTGPNVVGRIDLAAHQPKEKPVASSSSAGVS